MIFFLFKEHLNLQQLLDWTVKFAQATLTEGESSVQFNCIIRYHEGSKKHLGDPVPNSDFPVLHCLSIRSSVSGIRSDRIRKYMSKF
jgi:hypothetical protein